MQQILRINRDTLFKLRPDQASELAPNEAYRVTAGTVYDIQSYAYANAQRDFNNHIKFALKGTSIQGFNTWFVSTLDAQVEFDGKIVYPLEDQITLPTLRINTDTVLKRRPLQSEVLSENEQYEVKRGQSFDLHSYAYADASGDFSSHIKFALRNERDYIRGFSTWFVYDQHGYVVFDDRVVYPPEDPNTPILKVTQDTLFKKRPLPSSQLGADEVYAVPDGGTWVLHSYAYADASGDFNNHIKIALKYEKDFVQYLSTWFIYDGHAQIEINGRVVYPQPTPTPTPTPGPTPSPTYTGKAFRLPGNRSTFYTDQPIIPGGSFTWGEATKDATRIPPTVEIVENIIALARQLQRARNQIGRPFVVNSWYRPPAVNAAVGGVRNSQHLTGRAADLQIPGYSGRRVANAVLPWWNGGVGIYSNLPNVVHLDIGPRRYWGF